MKRIKLTSKLLAIVLFSLTFLSLMTYVYKYEYNIKTTTWSVRAILPNNDLFNNVTTSTYYKQLFEQVVAKSCDSKNISLNYACLEAINKIDETRATRQCHAKMHYFHTFWHLSANSKEISIRMLRLNVMSFLATQTHCTSKLMLWKLSSFPETLELNILNEFSYYIEKGLVEFQTFDLDVLCQELDLNSNSSHFARSGICLDKANRIDDLGRLNSIGLSDLVRFFVLDLYGG